MDRRRNQAAQTNGGAQADAPMAPEDSAELRFWDFRFTRFERLLLIFCVAIVLSLHLTPILSSNLAVPLVLLFSVIAWLTPVTGFFFIACTQHMPFPLGMPLNPTQIGFMTWCAVALFKYHRYDLRGAKYLLLFMPYMIWTAMTTGTISIFTDPSSEYFKALLYAIMAVQTANVAKGQYLKCLLGLSFGSLLVASAFWLHMLQLPVAINIFGAARAGVSRMGGVRSDAVMLWPAVLFAISGLAGIAFAALRSPRPRKEWNWLLTFGVLCSVAGLPPLLASMTTGGYVGLSLLLLVFSPLSALCFGRKRKIQSDVRLKFRKYLLLAAVILVALVVTDSFGLRGRMEKMWEYQQSVTEARGLGASRTDVWKTALRTIGKHPFVGAYVSGRDEEIPYEYLSTGYYLSHNVFLDAGRAGGIPGMILLLAFFFYPFFAMFNRHRRQKYFPFMFLHVAFFVFFMGLSFLFYKTFWAGWTLMAMAANSDRIKRKPGIPNGLNPARVRA